MTKHERARLQVEAIRFQGASAALYEGSADWAEAAATASYMARFYLFRLLGNDAFTARSKASSKLG